MDRGDNVYKIDLSAISFQILSKNVLFYLTDVMPKIVSCFTRQLRLIYQVGRQTISQVVSPQCLNLFFLIQEKLPWIGQDPCYCGCWRRPMMIDQLGVSIPAPDTICKKFHFYLLQKSFGCCLERPTVNKKRP